MARSIEGVQRNIERNRNQLARTSDELAVRTDPRNVADDAKTHALDALDEPKMQAALGAVAALVAGGITTGIRRNRNRSKEVDRTCEAVGTAIR